MRLRLATLAAVAVAASRGSDGARCGRARPRDRGAAGVAALEGDVLRQDRRARRTDDGEGPAGVPARRALPVTGELGPRTRAELGALGRPLDARRVLVQGTYGWDVSSLQFLLARAGHLRLLDVDGHFGASTKAGLVRFQRTRRLAVDGIAGPATLTAFGRGRRTPVLTKPTAPTSSTISYVVKAGRHAHGDRRQAQDDRPGGRRGQRPRVGEPRRRGRQAPPVRARSRPGRLSSSAARPSARTSTSGRRTTASRSASPARSRGRSPASRPT